MVPLMEENALKFDSFISHDIIYLIFQVFNYGHMESMISTNV